MFVYYLALIVQLLKRTMKSRSPYWKHRYVCILRGCIKQSLKNTWKIFNEKKLPEIANEDAIQLKINYK